MKLNGKRVYVFMHSMHFSKISGLRQHSEIILLFPYENWYLYVQEKSYCILNILLQTSINVSDNSITIVLQW